MLSIEENNTWKNKVNMIYIGGINKIWLKGTTGTEPVKRLKIQTWYHCGRIILEDPRGH